MTEQASATLSSAPRNAGARDRNVLGLLFLMTGAAYLSTLRFGFVFDDKKQIYFNPFIKAWKFVPQYFVNFLWRHSDPLALGHYYRPMYLVWLRFNYAMFGQRPMGWHLNEILLHLVVAWLVYRTVKLMTGQSVVAWLTALIFAIHPMQHEVVAWISGANESLYAAFFLAAFLAYLHFRQNPQTRWMVLSCASFGLALLAKESAIVLPVLIFAHEWIAGPPEMPTIEESFFARMGRSFRQVAFYLPIGLVYLIVRYKVMSGFSDSAPNLGFATCLLTLPSILYFYLKHWLFPFHMAEFYDLPYQTSLNMPHVLLPLAILLLAAGAVWAIRNRIGSRNAGYAAIWIFVPLLPALNVFLFRLDDVVHDRYFYVPSIGAALLVALLIEQLGARQKQRVVLGQPLGVVVVAFALAIVLAMLTVKAANFWQDDYTLFTRAQQIAPLNPGAINNLSVEWMSRGEVARAQDALERGLRQYPEDSRLATNLARAFYLKKQYGKAEELTRQAIALDPNTAESYLTLAEIQLKGNHGAEAQASMRRAVELNPFEATYHTIYGIVLEVNGNCIQAMDEFKAAQTLEPGNFFNQREMAKCGPPAASPAPASAPVPKPAAH